MRAIVVAGMLAALGACTSAPSPRSNVQASQAAQTHTQLAVGYLRQGRVEVAQEKIEQAIALDPRYAEAYSVAGFIYEQIGDMKGARRHYARAVKLAPENGDVLNNYGQFLCKMGEQEKAQSLFADAVTKPYYKTPEVALTNAGACAMKENDLEAAEEFFRRSLRARADNPDALFYMADLKLRQGDAFRARAFLQRHESVSPPSPEALMLGMRIEAALQDAEAEAAYREQLESLFPDQARDHDAAG